MRLDQLAGVQSVAATHVTFSLTLACPLKCAHCIVEAGPEKGYTTMPVEIARQYAEQMPELAARGIHTLSFTGGEPLLAREQLRVISNAAAEHGMDCGVVTAAHWSPNEEAALKVIESLPAINVWDISIDSYHEDFVSFNNVRVAYEAARKAGRQATIRFTYHDPLTEDDRRILDFIYSFADEPHICSQKVRTVGRGDELGIAGSHKFHPWTKPCVTQGMVVRYDGTLAPCCVNLVEARQHPFQFGDSRLRPLADIHADFMSHSLLQLIRVIGFVDLMRWLDDAGLADDLPEDLPDDVCDLCPMLFTNARLASYLADRASRPENRLRIAVLASRLLGEHEMLHRVVNELKDQGNEIEGYESAAALAAEFGLSNLVAAKRQLPVLELPPA